jgi:hypothetical protein
MQNHPNRNTNLQHVQQSGFAGVVQSKEQELGVFVEQAQRSEDIVDYS